MLNELNPNTKTSWMGPQRQVPEIWKATLLGRCSRIGTSRNTRTTLADGPTESASLHTSESQGVSRDNMPNDIPEGHVPRDAQPNDA